MGMALAYVVAGVMLCVAAGVVWDHFWSFRAQKLSDYAAEAPQFALPDTLSGTFTAHGLIYDYSGRVNIRFQAEIVGTFDETGGTLAEHFVYEGTQQEDRRIWRITFTGPSAFTATAADVVGTAKGEMAGNALRMTYRLRLPERAGGHVLDAVDWLYLMQDGSIVNRSDMRKFGLRAAELFAVFRPEERS
tara:strand:- start:843 stop:1412 length:570 start_codon:yes stop_codon:yes gene_type:complete